MRKRRSIPKMKCNACNRRIVDTFLSKLNHVYSYHPEILVSSLPRLAEFSRAAGEYLGEQLKRKVISHGSTKL